MVNGRLKPKKKKKIISEKNKKISRWDFENQPLPTYLSANIHQKTDCFAPSQTGSISSQPALHHPFSPYDKHVHRAMSDRNQEATVYVGNIDEQATEELIYELMLQAGPIRTINLPKDRVNQVHQGYGFVEFMTDRDAEYASLIMNQVRLFGKPLRVNKALLDKQQRTVGTGAELFIGNLDPMVDETVLNDAFSSFNPVPGSVKVTRDAETGKSKGFGFIAFDNFDDSDRALELMNGQWIMGKQVTVNYAFKRDGKGERHGDEAERMLAEQAKKNNYQTATLRNNLASIPNRPPIAPPGFG